LEIHKRRQVPFPARASINEKQAFKFTESEYMLTPYKVQKSTLLIVLPKEIVTLSYTKNERSSKSGDKLSYSASKELEPFSFNAVTIHYEN
jgi:hypothetical protein